MLRKKAVNKDWDKIMSVYWQSLPAQGTLHTKETFSRDSLDLLQDGSMVRYLLSLGSLASCVLMHGIASQPAVCQVLHMLVGSGASGRDGLQHWPL